MTKETLVLRDEADREHRVVLEADGTAVVGDQQIKIRRAADGRVDVSGPVQATAWTAMVGDTRWVFIDGQVFTFERQPQARSGRRRRTAAHHATLAAPMPATVRTLLVRPGDAVHRNDVLIVLEAMKMELPIRAALDGVVGKVNCREGDLVQPGVGLIEMAD